MLILRNPEGEMTEHEDSRGILLRRGRPRCVRFATLHVIAFAQHAVADTRGWENDVARRALNSEVNAVVSAFARAWARSCECQRMIIRTTLLLGGVALHFRRRKQITEALTVVGDAVAVAAAAMAEPVGAVRAVAVVEVGVDVVRRRYGRPAGPEIGTWLPALVKLPPVISSPLETVSFIALLHPPAAENYLRCDTQDQRT